MASNLLETHQNKWFAPFLPRGPQFFMFKKSVLKLSVLGVSTAPSYREAYRKRGGRTFSIGFLVGGIRTPKADVFRTDSNTNNKSRTSWGVRLRDR